MSKILWVCTKNEFGDEEENKIRGICDFISPDNIIPSPSMIKIDSNIAYGIMNPKDTINYEGNSVALGLIFGNCQKWHIPLEEIPDGSFAIFRNNVDFCEVVSDISGSRTIWYFFDEFNLIVSTSQVALIKYLGNFDFNSSVIPWMLSTGTLGPNNSWDKRVEKLPPDSSIILNKKKWQIKIKINPIIYRPIQGEKKNHEKKLDDVLNQTFQSIKINPLQWTLPLSGGVDSRGILFLLKENNLFPINTITWGLPEALIDKESDAYISKILSEKLNTVHQYFETGFSQEPLDDLINRFLKNGEGRIDHISGYLDGFEIWKELHNSNVQGIIRGDENFGWHEVIDERFVLRSVGINFFKEYNNFDQTVGWQDFSQVLPTELLKRSNESNPEWRDRLYHQFRLQCMISALSDLKLSYVEQISPLLSRNIIETVRQIPDQFRTNKIVFKSIVEDFEPNIEFATKEAIGSKQGVLHSDKFYKYLKKELSNNNYSEIFNESFIDMVGENIKLSKEKITNSEEMNLKKSIKKLIPRKIYDFFKKSLNHKQHLDYNKLAFRIIIIKKMNDILNKPL